MFRLAVLLLLSAAALVRMQNLFSGLEYDEIWTLENFSGLAVSKLFTELALPNNQPLNSLYVKLVTVLNGPVWAIRLHSLIAGILTIPLAGFIAWVLSDKNKTAAFAAMCFMAFSAPDVVYSSLARGYALQVFFLALYASGLAGTEMFRPGGKLKFLPETAMAAGGICAILTLPTSIVYLSAITLAAWLIHPVKPRRSLIIVLSGGVLFTLLWCIFNYQQLDAARVWGSKITSFADFYGFLAVTAVHLFGPLTVLLALVFCFSKKKKYLPLLLIIIIPLLSAVITNAGPPRTYIPFGCVFAVAAGCGAAEILKRNLKKNLRILIIVLLAALGCLEFQNRLKGWAFPDSREIFRQASQLPYTALVVHRATSGYPLAWNNKPEIYNDFVKRLLEHSNELVMFDGPGRINGLDSKSGESVLNAGTEGEETVIAGLYARRYKLFELTEPPAPGAFILAALRPVPKTVYATVFKQLQQSGIQWLKLNSWLSCPINSSEATYYYILLAGKVQKNNAEYWQGLLNNNGMLSLYRIDSQK